MSRIEQFAVHHHCELDGAEQDVRLTPESGQWPDMHPVPEPAPMQLTPNRELRRGTTRALLAHPGSDAGRRWCRQAVVRDVGTLASADDPARRR